MKCLALYLRAPLQSWGVGAKFGVRPTMSFPTRSGILGLLAASAGVDRADDGWLRKVSGFGVEVRAYRTEVADRGGGKKLRETDGLRLTDYHTVGGGRGKAQKGSWHCRMAVPLADGTGCKTELTSRDYLQDSAFGVVVSAEGESAPLVAELAQHLANPVWGVWLGRKSCIPTEPVLAGLFDGPDPAWDALAARAARAHRVACASVAEALPNDGTAEDVLMDVPVSFARREFASRAVSYPQQ